MPDRTDLGSVDELSKSLCNRLSPGDEAIREPYWYVNLWPYPHPSRLRPLRSACGTPKVGPAR